MMRVCRRSVGVLAVRTILSVLPGIAGCEGSEPAPALPDPMPAATNRACHLFTKAELASLAGTAVSAAQGGVAGPQSCRWTLETADPRSITVILVPVGEWRDGAGSPGGERLGAPGEHAFVAPWLDDQRAGTRTPGAGIYVLSPRRTLSVELLSRAAARVGGGEKR